MALVGVTILGAMSRLFAEIVPQGCGLFAVTVKLQVPRLQVTPRLLLSPSVVAVNWYVWLIRKGGASAGGVTVTFTLEVILMFLESDLVLSVLEVAVTVTVAGDGTICGAV